LSKFYDKTFDSRRLERGFAKPENSPAMDGGDSQRSRDPGAGRWPGHFLCPLCGSGEYEAVWVRTERGSVPAGIHHCTRCRFAFVDPSRYRPGPP
jgi:hypothetical protein